MLWGVGRFEVKLPLLLVGTLLVFGKEGVL